MRQPTLGAPGAQGIVTVLRKSRLQLLAQCDGLVVAMLLLVDVQQKGLSHLAAKPPLLRGPLQMMDRRFGTGALIGRLQQA